MKRQLIFIFLMFINLLAFAQVAINNNGAVPNANAILDVDVSTNDKGILIPRPDDFRKRSNDLECKR